MIYAVEAWQIPDDGEEPCQEREMVEAAEFRDSGDALGWLWERLQEGHFVRMFRR